MSGNGNGRAHHVHELSSVLDAALYYAQTLYLPIFPCRCADKKPFTQHGFHDASRDDAQVRAWWTQFPEAMIGMPTGSVSRAWVVDVDIDPAKGIDGFPLWRQLTAQHGEIPPTLTSVTPRGGKHYFFSWQVGLTIPSRTGFPGPGIDTRSHGGYVILPPSIRNDGASYRWDIAAGATPVLAPVWLVALLSPGKDGTGRGKPARKNPKRDQAWAQAALDGECARIAAALPGHRNAALNLGAYNVFQIVHGNPGLLDEVEVQQRLFAAAETCGLVADDGADSAWRTIKSGAAGAQSQPRVRPMARLEQPAGGAGNGGGGGVLGPGTAAGSGGGGGSTTGGVPGAAAPGAASGVGTRRIIQLVEGDYHVAADEGEEALLRAEWNHIYQRGGLLVRPVLEQLAAAENRATVAWRLAQMRLPFLLEMLERVATFTIYDRRRRAWVPRNCPERIGEMLLAREGVWRAPVVLGIVHTPQFRLDGSLAMAPGYDPGTRLLFKPDGETFPPVPERPTREQALAALKLIEEQIATFPFKTAVDHSVALSLFLTALCRRVLDYAPLHGASSPAAGTGKSMLVDLVSILLSGQDAPVISIETSREELEKRLGASLLAGDAIISFDNCNAPLNSTLLCQALTQQRLRIRVLGLSQQVNTPTSALFTATGNNLVLEGDLTRRSLLCELDAGVERPELRSFKVNPKTVFRQRRGELVAAGLTVLRAGRVAELAPISTPLGGYEMWSSWVRNPLQWLDQADPCCSMERLFEGDPDRDAHEAVVLSWRDAIGIGSEVNAQYVIDRANLIQELNTALLTIAEERNSRGFISAKRLGWWLTKVDGKVCHGLRIVRTGKSMGHTLWKLTTA